MTFVLYFGRFEWFIGDEWDFVSARSAGSIGDLFHPHNEHWMTLPILAYRLLWQTTGLHSYLPYLFLVVALHCVAAALLRSIMLRAGVGPWIATAAAALFALFGGGAEDITLGGTLGYNGTLVFGLTQLLLADHDGPIDRRDWLGLLAGFAALMCSGVAVPMTAVVGLAVFIRRGWRSALFHVAPLAAVFLVWLLAVGRSGFSGHSSVAQAFPFIQTYLNATVWAIGQIPGVGVVLAGIAAVGLVSAWRTRGGPDVRKRAAVPAAMLVGAVIFLFTAGIGRAGTALEHISNNGRFLDVTAAMMLPALAIGVQEAGRRWRLLFPVTLALLSIGIVGNVRALADLLRDDRAYRHYILSLPRLPIARELPASFLPDLSAFDAWVTMGWLRKGVASGRIPAPGKISPDDASRWTLMLALKQTIGPRHSGRCDVVLLPLTRTFNRSDSIIFTGPVAVTYVSEINNPRIAVMLGSVRTRRAYVVTASRLRLLIRPSTPRQRIEVCSSGV